MRFPLKHRFIVLSLSTISLLILAACAAPLETPRPASTLPILAPTIDPAPTPPHSTPTGLRFIEFYSPL